MEQFVSSWIKFVNCEVDSEQFEKMKMSGALVVKSNNGSEHKADVDVITQELNQSETQIASFERIVTRSELLLMSVNSSSDVLCVDAL